MMKTGYSFLQEEKQRMGRRHWRGCGPFQVAEHEFLWQLYIVLMMASLNNWSDIASDASWS